MSYLAAGTPNILLGCITILSAVILTIFSWRCAQKQQWKSAVFLLLASGLILRIFASLDGALHQWDERYHALVAKHLIQHPLKPTLYELPLLPYNYQNWTSNSIWLHKQPLALWLIALSLKVFGIGAFSVRIPSIILSSLIILLVYDIGAKLFSKRIGLISAFLCSIHGFLIDVASGRAPTDHVDAVFLFWVALGVWASIKYSVLAQKRCLLIVGFSIGAGVLTKWLPALIVIPLFVLARYNWRKPSIKTLLFEVAILTGIACCVAGPWQWYIFTHYPAEAAWEYKYNAAHLGTALEGHSGGFFYHFDNLRIQYGEAVYLPVILFTIAAFRTKKYSMQLIAFWFWAVYLFFSIVATKMAAYPLIAAPAIWVMTAWGIDYFLEKKAQVSMPDWIRYAAGIALIVLPIRYSIERLKPFIALDRQRHPQHLPLASTGAQTVIFKAASPIEEMFFGEGVAYEQDVDSITQLRLQASGFKVVTARK